MIYYSAMASKVQTETGLTDYLIDWLVYLLVRWLNACSTGLGNCSLTSGYLVFTSWRNQSTWGKPTNHSPTFAQIQCVYHVIAESLLDSFWKTTWTVNGQTDIAIRPPGRLAVETQGFVHPLSETTTKSSAFIRAFSCGVVRFFLSYNEVALLRVPQCVSLQWGWLPRLYYPVWRHWNNLPEPSKLHQPNLYNGTGNQSLLLHSIRGNHNSLF